MTGSGARHAPPWYCYNKLLLWFSAIPAIIGMDASDINSVGYKGFSFNSYSSIVMGLEHLVRSLPWEGEFRDNALPFQGDIVSFLIDMGDPLLVLPDIALVDALLLPSLDGFPVHWKVHRHEHVSAKYQLRWGISQGSVDGASNSICCLCGEFFKGVLLVEVPLLQVKGQ